MNKRGQFFILAAVIFSGLLLSVSLSVNQITTLKTNPNFYKSSEIINREISNVQSYQISSGDNSVLEEFAENLAANLLDSNPNLNFILIYGNSSFLIIRNFGSEKAKINDKELNGTNSQSTSKIKLDIGQIQLRQSNLASGELIFDTNVPKEINISYGDHEPIQFNITKENQMIYILQEESGGANYVDVK